MMMDAPVAVVCGHYGVGKTNLTLNIALDAAAGGRAVTVIDLDVVNPFFRSSDYRALPETMRGTFVKVVNQDLKGYLKDIKASTLLIFGDQDTDTPLYFGQIMEREIPDAGLVVLKGAGHFAYLERGDEFARIARVFLEGA